MTRWDRIRLLAGGVLTAWALWNAAAVYLVFAGEKQHRLETAVLLLVAWAVVSELVTRALRSQPPTIEAGGLDTTTWRAIGGLALALWLANAIATTGVPFLSDDYVLLARYQDSAAHAPQQFFRPVFGVVFRALSVLGGESTWPFRLASAALHIGSAVLVSRLTRRITESPAAATAGFVVFLLNPLQGEAVVWIAGLQETLWTFLALGALAVHAQDDWRPALRLCAVAALSGLAFGAKETAACLVLLLPGLDALTRRSIDKARLAVRSWPSSSPCISRSDRDTSRSRAASSRLRPVTPRSSSSCCPISSTCSRGARQRSPCRPSCRSRPRPSASPVSRGR
jgi:hypothetical protein